MIDSDKLLGKKQSAVVLIKNADYNKESMAIVKALAKGSVCYISLNKTCAALQEDFKKNKVNSNHVLIIDTISKTMKNMPDNPHCFYVSSPSALTELSLAVSKFLEYNFDYFIFDSVTNLTVYHSKKQILKFISSIMNRVRATNTKAIFYATDLKDYESLTKEVCTFVDKTSRI